MSLILRELEVTDEAEALAAHAEFPDWDFLIFYTAGMDWAEFVTANKKASQGLELPKGRDEFKQREVFRIWPFKQLTI